MINHQLKQK